MKITIDKNSGFCFGVVYAIEMAEQYLKTHGPPLYCLGDIVHNDAEVARLRAKGLITIDYEQFKRLKNTTVLIRAHGEPPQTYQIALKNNIRLLDASCPIVLKLQNRIRAAAEDEETQIIIYGKKGHPEVNGHIGQTQGKAIVIGSIEELEKTPIDYDKPIALFSQTTKNPEHFYEIARYLKQRARSTLKINDTICRQVSGREPQLRAFAKQHDVIIFVAGKKSSNGKVLFKVCKEENPRTYFVSVPEEVQPWWFEGVDSVGICGATSTPQWLMEKVKEHILHLQKVNV